MSASSDLEPADFLQRIQQLTSQREKEDSERLSLLEEEIIQSRNERLARRAERARSLSPEKQSPTHESPTTIDPSSMHSTPREDSLRRVTGAFPPSSSGDSEQIPPKAQPPPDLTDKQSEPPAGSPSAAIAPSRSGTLSWQRRPASRAARRPLSFVAPEKEASGATADARPGDDQEPSKSSIIQALGSKDPSWFRQTPDRGISSAAYRKSQEDTGSDAGSTIGTRRLPGMSKEPAVEAETASSPPPESMRSSSPSRASSIRSTGWSNRFSTTTSVSSLDGRSPIPIFESQKFTPLSVSDKAPSIDGGDSPALGRSLAMSPSQGRISPERMDRPPSPTKGMGGFVQSAMLKRSDSQNKRWSTHAAPAPNRTGSTASTRSSIYGGLAGSSSMPKLEPRPSSLGRGNSIEPASRPSSSHSNQTITQDSGEKTDGSTGDKFVRPALPHHSRTKSTPSFIDDHPSEFSPPPSPSKRWSPTKSSWLESALNRPDSPKPKLPPPEQPSWMREISKARQRNSVDITKSQKMDDRGEASPFPRTGADGGSTTETPVGIPAKTATPESASTPKAKSEKQPISHGSQTTSPPTKAKPASLSSRLNGPQPEDNVPGADTAEKASDLKQSSASTKPKPDAPSKRDFRSTLRHRESQSEAPRKKELEFQNVFGKLRRTQTEKYEAPNELKNNILRGKAGLNATGGFQKTERRDELKESLLKQKEAMKSKGLDSGAGAEPKKSGDKPGTSLPEALQMRRNLGRTGSVADRASTFAKQDQSPPEAIARSIVLKAAPSTSSLRSTSPTRPAVSPETESPSLGKPQSSEDLDPNRDAPPAKEPPKSSKLADRFNPALAGMLARGPSPLTGGLGPPKSTASPGAPEGSEPAKSKELTHITKGRARGPKRRAPTATPSQPKASETKFEPLPKESPLPPPEPAKPRDVGPNTPAKRVKELEFFKPTPAKPSRDSLVPSETPAKGEAKPKPATPAKSPRLSDKIQEAPLSKQDSTPLKRDSTPSKRDSTPRTSDSPKPPVARKPPSIRGEEGVVQQIKPQSPRPLSVSSPNVQARKEPVEASATISKPETNKIKARMISIPAVQGESQEEQSPSGSFNVSVRNAATHWGRQENTAPGRTKSPIKLPTREDEMAAMENAGLLTSSEPAPKPIGLGLAGLSKEPMPQRTKGNKQPEPTKSTKLPLSPPLSAGLPPKPVKKPEKLSSREPSMSIKVPPASMSARSPKRDNIFAGHFDEPPVTEGDLSIDTQAILKSTPLDSGKIKTLRKHLQEIFGDGKIVPVPPHEEYILFETSMYLCTHIFGSSNGTRTTEVYLWAGSSVPEGTLDDAMLFARKSARECSGKLIVFRQGKESPNFFQALGGIVITRRAKRSGSASYMLCGRRHMGHVAFDEVELSLHNFCSGFAFIISSPTGQLYLWKGIGCSAEELGCARLIGMDIGLTGEIEEIDEGHEPPEFFSIFPPLEDGSRAIPKSADHWRLKASYDGKYNVRLFRVEQHTPHHGFQTPTTPYTPKPQVTVKVEEIAPFCQSDVEAEHIYVLDAFFEIYIIVGPLTRNQSQAFSTALLFAQEYGILAASLEDRPLIPISTVVLEGVPKDMRAVFRRWEERFMPTSALMAGKLRKSQSLMIVGLTEAIEACRL